MAAPSVIALADVGLCYRVHFEKTSTLKEYMLGLVKRRNGHRDLWAVRGVNLQIGNGEVVGLIGRNGSGKSTLLKLVAGVLQPTEGKLEVGGSVSALIELGAGFNGELTGRENVFLSGALMGRGRKAMEARYDDIVEFSGLEDFMDVPVKNYSSGMYMRLGFAIATDVDPDVLLIDEILAVGDEEFQQKCLERVEGFREAGKTILYVSHDLVSVERMCTRVFVVDGGKICFEGEPKAAVEHYLSTLDHSH